MLKNKKFYVIILITFVVIFLMNYLGNDQPDKLSRAVWTGLGGAIGLGIGLFIFQKFGKDNDQLDLD